MRGTEETGVVGNSRKVLLAQEIVAMRGKKVAEDQISEAVSLWVAEFGGAGDEVEEDGVDMEGQDATVYCCPGEQCGKVI